MVTKEDIINEVKAEIEDEEVGGSWTTTHSDVKAIIDKLAEKIADLENRVAILEKP